MDEMGFREKIRKIKIKTYIAVLICIIPIMVPIVGLGFFRYQSTFSTDKWHRAPEERRKIVSDLLKRHKLVGMTEGEVISLLGEEESYASTKTSFKMSKAHFDPDTTIVYYLGIDYMDDMWLILSLKNGIVISFHIDIT